MKLLHVARIGNDKTNGVHVVVPQHIIWQAKDNEVAFINYNNTAIKGLEEYQIEYNKSDILYPVILKMGSVPDLIIFHEVNNFENISAYKQILRHNLPYIIIPHGELNNEALHKKWLKKKIAYLLFFNKFIKKSKAIQCLSKHEADNTNFKTRKFIGTNGVVLPSIKKEVFHENGLRFVYVGRLNVYHKGLDILIKAVSLMKSYILSNKCVFHIYGPDYQGRYDSLKYLIEENELQDIIILDKEILGEEKEKTLLNSDCFIQTSRFEGMPTGILEALSYGLPCLVTEGTTLGKEIRESNAGWVCATDVESVAATIKQVMDEKAKLKEKSEGGRRLIEEQFQWDCVVSKTLEIYHSLIK